MKNNLDKWLSNRILIIRYLWGDAPTRGKEFRDLQLEVFSLSVDDREELAKMIREMEENQ